MRKFLDIDLKYLQFIINSTDKSKWLYIEQFSLEAKLIAHRLGLGKQQDFYCLHIIRHLKNYLTPIIASNAPEDLIKAKQYLLLLAQLSEQIRYPEFAQFIYAKQIALCADIMRILEMHISNDVKLTKFYFAVRDSLLITLEKLCTIPDAKDVDRGYARSTSSIFYSFRPLSLWTGVLRNTCRTNKLTRSAKTS